MSGTYGIRVFLDGKSYFVGRALTQTQAADLADDLHAVLVDDLGTRFNAYPERECDPA
jgi:hypothetical protein